MKMNRIELRQEITELFKAGLEAIKPDFAVNNICRVESDFLHIGEGLYQLSDFKNIYVIGAGKGTAPMASAIESILDDKLTDGIIVVKHDHTEVLTKIRMVEAAHPVPDIAGKNGAKDILRMAENANKDDLVICLISGGGSALLPLPAGDISLEDKQKTTEILLSCGARIHEVNTIRKHLSLIKGGFLAEAVYPATLVTLIISDVIGDDLDVIASGPTFSDNSSFIDCCDIIKKYEIASLLPLSVQKYLSQGLFGKVPETPKSSNICFSKSYHSIIASNTDAISNIEKEAQNRGYNTLILSTMMQGESKEVAKALIAIGQECLSSGRPVRTPACIIVGGETTVSIKGRGKGGRNQEMALSAAIEMQDSNDMMFLSCGTDGTDGPTDAAGAVADPTTVSRAKDLECNPQLFLENNDSYHFFQEIDDLVKTGPTNTNVMDVQILLVL